MNTCVYMIPKEYLSDHHCLHLKKLAAEHLQIETGRIKVGKIFEFQNLTLDKEEKEFVEFFLTDSVSNSVFFDSTYSEPGFSTYCVVSKRAGITDDESRCAEKTFEDRFSRPSTLISSHTLYMFERNIPEEEFEKLASTLLGNPLIQTFSFGQIGRAHV